MSYLLLRGIYSDATGNIGIGSSIPHSSLDISGDMTINRNVGIGTALPSYKLDVNGTIYASGDVIMFSDERYKTHIEPLSNAIDMVAKLKGIRFKWLNGTPDDRTHIGLIAQDVEKVLPEAVYTNIVTGKKSVAYPALAGAFAQALNETNERLKIIEKQITDIDMRLSTAGL